MFYTHLIKSPGTILKRLDIMPMANLQTIPIMKKWDHIMRWEFCLIPHNWPMSKYYCGLSLPSCSFPELPSQLTRCTYLTFSRTPVGTPITMVAPSTLYCVIFFSNPYSNNAPNVPALKAAIFNHTDKLPSSSYMKWYRYTYPNSSRLG